MRFFKAPLALVLFAASALGQSVGINFPVNGSTVTPGSDYTVQLSYPIYIQNVDWVSVVVGLLGACTEISGCPTGGPSNGVGVVLSQVPYTPENGPGNNIVQNITVTIPDSTPSGAASLSVVGFFLVGDFLEPGLHYANVTLLVD